MELGTYSLGIGDRFGRQGKAQLAALCRAAEAGVEVTPVWNKSHREHQIIGTAPSAVRQEADAATAALGWDRAYHVDADHIGLKTVDLFLESSDFFTLDVADAIGAPADPSSVDAFVNAMEGFSGKLEIPGIAACFDVGRTDIRGIAETFLYAVQEAGRLYRHIAMAKGSDGFITEVSMDETSAPQTPVELFFILAALAREGIPAQTIAPKFTGRFNKGVEYVGDTARFAAEFRDDICVIAHAVKAFGLPPDLKLSVHSGSDKFSLYPCIADAVRRSGAGLHLKTAGTTWLEELIGLACAGGEGLRIAQTVYRGAYDRFEPLCRPYAAVIAIDRNALPAPDVVDGWDGARFAAALRHDQACPEYNPHLRQLLHVGYKVAAELGERYTEALEAFEAEIAVNVTGNLLERHLKPLFLT